MFEKIKNYFYDKEKDDKIKRLEKLCDEIEEEKLKAFDECYELKEENKKLKNKLEGYREYVIKNVKVDDTIKPLVERMREKGIPEYEIIHNFEEMGKYINT